VKHSRRLREYWLQKRRLNRRLKQQENFRVTVKKLRTKVVSVGWEKYAVWEGETSPLTIPEAKISSLQKTLSTMLIM